MIQLTDINDFESRISADTAMVLVDFYADWCEPCKWLDVILQSLEPRLQGVAGILQVDIESFPLLRDRFHIRGIPVLILFKQGVEVWRMNGFLAENELLEKVKSFQ